MKKLLIIYSIFFWALTAHSQSFEGAVVKVSDGDTITVQTAKDKVKVRLFGIDAPEAKQPYGDKATNFVKRTVLDEYITAEKIATDRYGRTVALVYLGDFDVMLNEELIRNAYAWVYKRYCNIEPLCSELSDIERSNMSHRKGIFSQDNPIPPWEWRRMISP